MLKILKTDLYSLHLALLIYISIIYSLICLNLMNIKLLIRPSAIRLHFKISIKILILLLTGCIAALTCLRNMCLWIYLMALTFGSDLSGRYKVAVIYTVSYGVQQLWSQICQLVNWGRRLLSTGLLLYLHWILINLGLLIFNILLLLAIKNSLTAVSCLLPTSINFNATTVALNFTAWGQRKALLEQKSAAFTFYTLFAIRLLYQRIKIHITRCSVYSIMMSFSMVTIQS